MRGVALALVLVAATLASSGRASLHVDLSALVRPLPESVSEWTPIDVETWVNRTLGYPEYSSIVREHLIDGPTLVMLDVEKTFAPKYHVHGVKFRAHIDILRGRCACPQRATDFWSFFETRSDIVLRLGSFLAFAPRAGFVYVFAWDTEAYNALFAPSLTTEQALEASGANGVASTVPWYLSLIYTVLAFVAPYALLAYKVLSVWTLNWFIMTPILLAMVVEQLNEAIALLSIYRVLRTGADIPLKTMLREMFVRYSLLAPLVVNVLAFVLPTVVAQVVIWVFVGHCALLVFSTGLNIVFAFFGKGGDESHEHQE